MVRALARRAADGLPVALSGERGRVSADGLQELRARGKGLARGSWSLLNHLPLRGKLGWMTPRAGVKTTLAMRRAFRGP